ncbi:MAG: hypothetical protein IJC04_06730 [Oscillospiraceae bacterium]|nr:hypothetical protein [Oscillospiraceae bacterium]
MAFFKRKRYNIFVKLIAIALFILVLIMVWGTVLIVGETSVLSSYDSYYEWEITGHTIEKLDDGKYKLTLDVKNTSAYDAYIDKYTLKLEYGDYNYIDYPNTPYPEGYFYESLNETLIPPGETIKHSITFEAPEGLRSFRVRYNGESYMLSEARDRDSNYKYYDVDLK